MAKIDIDKLLAETVDLVDKDDLFEKNKIDIDQIRLILDLIITVPCT